MKCIICRSLLEYTSLGQRMRVSAMIDGDFLIR
jgi:hypothetical protein